MKCGRGVSKSKGNNKEFEEAIVGTEGHFPFVTLFDTNEVVGVPKVNFGDDFSFLDAGQGFVNQGEGVAIFDGSLAQATAIKAGSEGACLFLDERHWGGYRGRGGPDESFGVVIVYPFLQGFQFVL